LAFISAIVDPVTSVSSIHRTDRVVYSHGLLVSIEKLSGDRLVFRSRGCGCHWLDDSISSDGFTSHTGSSILCNNWLFVDYCEVDCGYPSPFFYAERKHSAIWQLFDKNAQAISDQSVLHLGFVHAQCLVLACILAQGHGSKTYAIAPDYDTATFFAVLSIVPASVLFVVKVETSFYERYRNFVRPSSMVQVCEISGRQKRA
jgi:hypothetical protein